MAGKSLEQRVVETEERIRQLQARKLAIEQQLRQRERKDRTRRLIQVGAIMSKLGVDSLEKAQALQREVGRRHQVREWLQQIIQGSQQIPDQPEGAGSKGAETSPS